MRKILYGLMGLAMVAIAVSCSETEADEAELVNWKDRNEAYFDSLYQVAKANPLSYKLIRHWSLEEKVATEPDDFIIVQVINEGKGTASPIYTDSVRVHYRGKYIPSKTYPSGYVFDQSWTGDYDLQTMHPVTLSVSGVVDGFATALQNMHPGDRWIVTIPYALGYGADDYSSSSSSTSIPGGSNLIFDLTMVSFYHPGTTVPDAQAKPFIDWGDE